MAKKKAKELERGKDFDAWAVRERGGGYNPWTEPREPANHAASEDWVRVKFVEVKREDVDGQEESKPKTKGEEETKEEGKVVEVKA